MFSLVRNITRASPAAWNTLCSKIWVSRRGFAEENEESLNRKKMQEMMIEKLKKEAGATIVDVKDISYDAGYLLEMVVVSPKFEGMKLLQQHRLLNKILSDELSILHGITFKCMTPAQYENMEKKE